MDQGLTYHEALKILGVQQGRLMAMLDEAAADSRIEAPMSLRVLQEEIIAGAQAIFREMPEWRTGSSRFTRSERLAAAHTVMVISSYFEVLAQKSFPAPVKRQLSDQSAQITRTANEASDEVTLIIQYLLHRPLAVPEPHQPDAKVHEHRQTDTGT